MKLANQQLGIGGKPALLVVDASRGFTDPSSPLGSGFDAELACINRLIEIASDAAWPKFFSTVYYESAAEASVFREKVPALNGLNEGSHWADIDPRLHVSEVDTIFRKTHASCFYNTDLDARLRTQAIDSLVVCGFTTSGCVRASAVDALQYNYRTTVIADAVGDRDAAAHSANLYDLDAKYTDVLNLDELKQNLVK